MSKILEEKAKEIIEDYENGVTPKEKNLITNQVVDIHLVFVVVKNLLKHYNKYLKTN